MGRIRTAALVAALALGGLAPAAHANQGIFGTWWHPNDTKGDGWGFGFRSKTQIAPLVSFDTRISWVKFKDDDLNVFPIEATGMLRLGMIYAGIGVGYYFFDSNGATDLKNNFGWYGVGGIDIPAGPVGIFGEVKWMQLSTDVKNVDTSIPNAPTSLSADGIGVNLGVMLSLPKM